MKKRSSWMIYLFEFTNAGACIVLPILILFNAGGWFFPKIGSDYTANDLLACIKSSLVVLIVFAVVVGIPLIMLFYDCFVTMKDVEGFQVSTMSIIMAPASYPLMRTNALEEPKNVRTFHTIAGSSVFVTNVILVISVIYYLIRILASFFMLKG
ncbi:MAG: hypothetical protein IJ079_07015 [Lachnospiraceae bacterium]|nr:hypothetical protein [Lachnospiraceae bacterium]